MLVTQTGRHQQLGGWDFSCKQKAYMMKKHAAWRRQRPIETVCVLLSQGVVLWSTAVFVPVLVAVIKYPEINNSRRKGLFLAWVTECDALQWRSHSSRRWLVQLPYLTQPLPDSRESIEFVQSRLLTQRCCPQWVNFLPQFLLMSLFMAVLLTCLYWVLWS